MSADYHDVINIEKRMKSASSELRKLELLVAHARTVKGYDKDRRKRLLATYMVKYLKQGESAVAAEAMALADPLYGKELDDMAAEFESAELVLKKDADEYTSWETCRSLLARQRETFRRLPEET